MIYYQYLNSLYFIDEIYDINGPKEYDLNEKLTIRVIATDNINHLKTFISKYSLCQCVHEIQIIWLSSLKKKPPLLSEFTFAHTHSIVTFDITDRRNYHLQSGLTISTEG